MDKNSLLRPREAGTTPNGASFSVSPESRNIFRQDKSLRTIPIPESESYREGGREGVNATICTCTCTVHAKKVHILYKRNVYETNRFIFVSVAYAF